MHNALVVFYSIFFILSTSIGALSVPQFRLSHYKPTDPTLANKCTFSLWHKQIQNKDTKTNYIQLNELQDHSNGIVIDIAALRPVVARNSYSLISDRQVFAVEGLLDNTNLTIRGEDGSDEVRCEHDGVRFSSEEGQNSIEAYCKTGAWDNTFASFVGSRLHCTFPCAKIDEEDLNTELR
ncbi:hypothetical protein DE146DRAFT_622269 [Phaeosphaeria sp. MPI-PUGE-AT-0046c]|nr:hypothetical protein DE146DRAFT_622269 [Phaeosphaeria sp. MPI-PUGE-AT-0046c]